MRRPAIGPEVALVTGTALLVALAPAGQALAHGGEAQSAADVGWRIAVGLPLDCAVIRRDAQYCEMNRRIEGGDPYFEDLRSRWSNALRAAHQSIPRPPYDRT